MVGEVKRGVSRLKHRQIILVILALEWRWGGRSHGFVSMQLT